MWVGLPPYPCTAARFFSWSQRPSVGAHGRVSFLLLGRPGQVSQMPGPAQEVTLPSTAPLQPFWFFFSRQGACSAPCPSHRSGCRYGGRFVTGGGTSRIPSLAIRWAQHARGFEIPHGRYHSELVRAKSAPLSNLIIGAQPGQPGY